MISQIRTLTAVACLATFAFVAPLVAAQNTTGSIFGQVTDGQGGAIPGVVVDATNVDTGLIKTAQSDSEGLYRLSGLPVGRYKTVVTLSGFETTESTIVVDLGTNIQFDVKMALEAVVDTINVTAPAPRKSDRGQVVDTVRLEGLPAFSRQLGDLAANLPGVGMGFHSDPSKGNQRTPQVNGSNGRNLNVIVDGGDNNDDVVGGIAQTYPLESVEQFKFLTQRFDSEFGRANSAMVVVTKSGTNNVRGSLFAFMRDDAMNAKTFTEQLGGVDKQIYQRHQQGGSVGGPIVQNKAHYFFAYERLKQDTKQLINTNGNVPGDGIYNLRVRQDLFSGKVTAVPTTSQYLAVRYARDHNSQPSGAARNAAYTSWATSTNVYDSVNLNHHWTLKGTRLNEFVFQFSDYNNDTPANVDGPAITFADQSRAGASQTAPQTTAQRRWQFRNDYSWAKSGVGLSHEFRTGVNIVRTPRLLVSNAGGTQGIMTMRGNTLDSGVRDIMVIGGTVNSNIPTALYGFYFQDDWRATDRLTVNVGARYDYLSGFVLDQTSANFANMQAAGVSGRFAGTLLEDFGKSPRGDRNNVQPRLGAVYDINGNGRNLVRGGWGIYTELAYTNSNLLTSSLEGGGIIASQNCLTTSASSAWCDPARGLTLSDGTLFTPSIPWTALSIPTFAPTTGEVVSPRLQQPFSYQSNMGWEHQVNRETTLTVDYVRVTGRNLNMRMRPNVDIDPSSVVRRYLAGVGVTPDTTGFRTALSAGRSQYDALIFGGRRRWAGGFDLDASYTLSKATSDVGTAADELAQNLLQDIRDPFSDYQMGPSTRTDARHRVNASAIVEIPFEVRVATTVTYRSALPVTTLEGMDSNADGVPNDQTLTEWRYAGLTTDGKAMLEETGPCKTVNCSRRAPFSQVNLRVSRAFRLTGQMRLEAIGEVYNLFNAKNPFIQTSTTYVTAPNAITPYAVPMASFMQPQAFAGDANQGEQRIGQLGLRLSF